MEDIDAIALLQDPLRRRLYEFVAAQGREVGRNEAAEAAGVARTLAAFHLDKLVDAGLLEAGSRRLTGRSGPGAGRPAKVYRRSAVERDVSVRRGITGRRRGFWRRRRRRPVWTWSFRTLRGAGGALRGGGGPCGDLDDVAEVLAGRGYEPVRDEGGAVLRMRNCPFHAVAEQFPPLVCGMNLALLEGLVEGSRVRVRMDPRPGWCCVAAEPSKNNED